MSEHNLIIITNEKISNKNESYYCDNIDIKITAQKLQSFYDVTLVGRKSKSERAHRLILNDISTFNNFFSFLINLKKFKINPSTKFLVISLTPFSFCITVILWLINKRVFLYFRSDGFKEYEKILGFLGPLIYGCMFSISTKISTLISCQKYILRKKIGFLVEPSQLNNKWFENTSTPSLKNINLLYVGRIKIEKGIFDLIEFIENKENIKLTIVGASDNKKNEIRRENIDVFSIETEEKRLIEHYDKCNIFVLPSFTEGYPQVLIEALARLRPVIIFKEIQHVVGKFNGIFVAERNYSSLEEKINYIKKNYRSIQADMKKNQLPTNNKFIEQIKEIISQN